MSGSDRLNVVVSTTDRLKLVAGPSGHVVDQTRLPTGVASIKLATDVPAIQRLALRARSMNLHELDLNMVVVIASRLENSGYPDGDSGSITRVAMFEGALVAYCRCFDSGGRASIGDSIFIGSPFRDLHHEMRERRRGFVAHDSNGGREAEVFVDIKPDGTPGGTYLMSLSSPHVTRESISTLRTLAEFALDYTVKQQWTIQGAIGKIMKGLSVAELAALPPAEIRSPERDDLSQKKKPRARK